jgi:site-specific DNA-adenine methylase
MSPEILIICMIMLNEIKLKLIGLYHNIEQDIETVNQGIERTRFNGDEEAIKNSKIMTSNMGMSRFFESLRDQLKMKKEYEQD